MIELPEAVAISKNLNETIPGKRMIAAGTGAGTHKGVSYQPSREELAAWLVGKTVSEVSARGRSVHIGMSSNQALVIDEFGGKVLYSDPDSEPPKKHHLLTVFDDNSCLTIAIQGWGFMSTLTEWQRNKWTQLRADALSPIEPDFTLENFSSLVEKYPDKGKDSIKAFFTNGKSVAGIGNGYLQDILFQAEISPKRKVADISAEEIPLLYGAVKQVIDQAVHENGRCCERDIFGNPGNYTPLMDRNTQGQPCPHCKTPIQKISYLGGSCYLCPTCQT